MGKAFFMGAPAAVGDRQKLPVGKLLEATGRNTGNLLIGDTLFHQLAYDSIETYDGNQKPDYVNSEFELVVIAAANFLYRGFDFGYMADYLEKLDLPVFIVGLGAQLPDFSADRLDGIPEGTWRLVHVASERSKSIGVRGYRTADLLHKHGIRNVKAIGCPSLYAYSSAEIRIRREEIRSLADVVINGSRNVVSHSYDARRAAAVEVMLFNFARANGCPYVYQNEQPEISLACGDESEESLRSARKVAQFFSVPYLEFVEFVRRQGKVFFSVEEWFEWIRHYKFCLGTRFHGNIAALRNGKPAVVIVHDARTRELCEFAYIPHIPVHLIERLDVIGLYERTDFSAYEGRYNALYKKYVDFLNENGIRHKLHWEAASDASQIGSRV